MTDELKPPPIPREEPEPLPQTTQDAILSELRTIRGDTDSILDNQRRTNNRLLRIEERQDEFEGRLMRNSARVRQPSEHDMAAQAELSKERTAREELAKRVDTMDQKIDQNNAWTRELFEAGTGFAKAHPQLVTAMVGFAFAALGWATHWLQGGH